MSFFANAEKVWIEFGEGDLKGWRVALKGEMDAGDQDAFEKAIYGVNMDGSKEDRTMNATISPGSLKLLELNIIRIESPEGKNYEPTPDILRKLSREVMARLLAKIDELNPPFAELRARR